MGLPGTVPSDAPQLAQSLREGVAALPFFFFSLPLTGEVSVRPPPLPIPPPPPPPLPPEAVAICDCITARLYPLHSWTSESFVSCEESSALRPQDTQLAKKLQLWSGCQSIINCNFRPPQCSAKCLRAAGEHIVISALHTRSCSIFCWTFWPPGTRALSFPGVSTLSGGHGADLFRGPRVRTGLSTPATPRHCDSRAAYRGIVLTRGARSDP